MGRKKAERFSDSATVTEAVGALLGLEPWFPCPIQVLPALPRLRSGSEVSESPLILFKSINESCFRFLTLFQVVFGSTEFIHSQ